MTTKSTGKTTEKDRTRRQRQKRRQSREENKWCEVMLVSIMGTETAWGQLDRKREEATEAKLDVVLAPQDT